MSGSASTTTYVSAAAKPTAIAASDQQRAWSEPDAALAASTVIAGAVSSGASISTGSASRSKVERRR